MGRLLRNFALMSVLILGGVAAGCQPEQKECHCTGANCNCPLPPAKKPPASDSGEDKSDAGNVAQHHKQHRVHIAQHDRHHRVHLARRFNGRTRSAAATHGHAHRVAAAFSRGHVARIAFTHGHASALGTHRGGTTSHSTRHFESRLAGRGMDGAGKRPPDYFHRHGFSREGWSEKHREAREDREESYEGSGWSGRARRHANAPLSYNYQSRSRAYSSPQQWAHIEGRRAEQAPHRWGRHEEYSERRMRRENARAPYGEDTYQGDGYGPDYDAGAPEEEAPPASRSGGAAGHWTMSINAPEALDSWHRYGFDCPDWGGGG